MKTLSKGLCLSATIAVLALPATAAAEYLVPPGNSAATQYTETVPTAGGHRDAEKESKGGNRSPAAVLGAGNARRLDEQGREGREVAEFAAETAPEETVEETPAPSAPPSGEPSGKQGGDSKKSQKPKQDRDRDEAAERDSKPEAGVAAGAGTPPPSGSSGLLEVLAEATGASSTGQVGVLLPLAILATLAWALAFLWRQRNRSTL